MKLFKYAPLFFAVPLLGSCSKSPSGGATVQAPNRLSVVFRTPANGPINNSGYIYSFAFDDDDNSSDGPVAIVGPTTVPNGVVAGSFTVLVEYQGGQYNVYRRTALANGTETLDPAPGAFVTQPSPASGNTLNFTLNLDATTSSGARLFRAGAQRLDINFVTANERRRDPNDNLRKAVDTFGDGRLSLSSGGAYVTLDIRSTRTYNDTSIVGEPSGDVRTDDTSGTINLPSLDITDFAISVLRS